jgi:hypothetical protein
MLAGVVALSAAILCIDAGRPAVAGGQFSVPDYRSNFVYRPWGARHTYRFTHYDSHHTLLLGPRYHYRLRRQGFDFQRHDPWAPRIEAHREGLK